MATPLTIATSILAVEQPGSRMPIYNSVAGAFNASLVQAMEQNRRTEQARRVNRPSKIRGAKDAASESEENHGPVLGYDPHGRRYFATSDEWVDVLA